MEKEIPKLYMKDMTRQKMYDLFGIEEVLSLVKLDDWLSSSSTISLTDEEKIILKFYQNSLLQNIKDWNEHELSMGFIGPIINLINFKIPYKISFFAQRPLSGVVENYELIGRPDGTIAKGGSEPQKPYFCFQEYKKDVDSSGDPIGQNLAAMLVGQELNEEEDVVYGCYVVGRLWYFMVLQGKKFAISKDYSATHDDDILNVVCILKALRSILFKKLGIDKTL